MVKLFRCRVCGDPYIGTDPPNRCPFCGAYANFIVEAKDYKETFDIELNEKEKSNAEKALEIEISNAGFYFCAAKQSDDEETRQLFEALGKVEAEHASIWRKVLKKPNEASPSEEKCSNSSRKNIQESLERETKAIDFYSKAAAESENKRLKQIFIALVQVEKDHLELDQERLK